MSATAITISNVLRVQSRPRRITAWPRPPAMVFIALISFLRNTQLHRLQNRNAIDIAIASTYRAILSFFPFFFRFFFSLFPPFFFFPSFLPPFLPLPFRSAPTRSRHPPSSPSRHPTMCPRIVTWLLCMDFCGAFLPSLFTHTETPITIGVSAPSPSPRGSLVRARVPPLPNISSRGIESDSGACIIQRALSMPRSSTFYSCTHAERYDRFIIYACCQSCPVALSPPGFSRSCSAANGAAERKGAILRRVERWRGILARTVRLQVAMNVCTINAFQLDVP